MEGATIVFIALLAVAFLAIAVTIRIRREYRYRDTLSMPVVYAVWALYLVHLALTCYAAWYSSWIVPVSPQRQFQSASYC